MLLKIQKYDKLLDKRGMSMNNLENERQKLLEIKNMYKKLLDYYQKKIDFVTKFYKKEPYLQANLLEQYTNKILQIERHLDDPFFGRIDFTQNNIDKTEKCYIGKVGILDEAGNIITVDWRAPIATLFYDSNLGPAEYLSPSGIIKGNLDLKRQFDIKDGVLVGLQDVDTVSNDELLKPFLSTSADNRLKNIVATIQTEQNNIIRKSLRENNIIQGTAGAGKTTVALHRIAYLVYNEQKNYSENQFIIIGPNAYFMDYISNVLPDLDVNTVRQYTFLSIVQSYVNDKFKIINQNVCLENTLNGKKDNIIKYKSSLDYKNAIEKFISDIRSRIIHGSLSYKGIKIIDEKVISNYFDKKDLSIKESIKEFTKYVKKYLKDNADEFKHLYWLKFREEYLSLPKDSERRKEILEDTDNFNKEINNHDKLVNNYFANITLKPLELYDLFVSNCEKYLSLNENDLVKFKKQTKEAIQSKNLGYEDLPAIMYLNLILNGYKDYDKYIHVVVDEAQDFGMFHFWVIKKLFKNSTFSIFGDLAQSIYSYQSILNWDEVINNVFEKNCNLLTLEKSYRTTYEIMECANMISKCFEYGNAKAVLRHGDNVGTYKVSDNVTDFILNKLDEYQKTGYKSIAIICKSELDTNSLAKLLSKNKINLNIISSKNTKFDGGICLVPSYLAKGLEFDAVIIYNSDSYNYENELDMKLLYVAMTRALHKLDITYQNELILPLKELQEKELKRKF